MQTIKDQLARLSATTIRVLRNRNGEAETATGQIVGRFNVWFPKDGQQRILWPSTIRLSLEYFHDLPRHAVPLNEAAVGALSHSAMGLDIYAWLAQRLHRIPPEKPAFVPWAAFQTQFGWNYDRIRAFRNTFKSALEQVYTQYRTARFELSEKGMQLWYSPPPVQTRGVRGIALMGPSSTSSSPPVIEVLGKQSKTPPVPQNPVDGERPLPAKSLNASSRVNLNRKAKALILCISSSENRLTVRRFMLEQNGFTFLGVLAGEFPSLGPDKVDLVLTDTEVELPSGFQSLPRVMIANGMTPQDVISQIHKGLRGGSLSSSEMLRR
jgi:hypothetical protein